MSRESSPNKFFARAELHSAAWLLRRTFWLPLPFFALFSLLSWGTRVLAIAEEERNFPVPAEAPSRVFELFGENASLLPTAAVACGIFCAFVLFGFLWKKNESTMYYLLGVSRTSLFCSRFAWGAVSAAISAVLPVFISFGFQRAHFDCTWDGLAWDLTRRSALCLCAVTLAAYALTVLVVSLTGSPFTAGLSLAGLLSAPLSGGWALNVFAARFLFGSALGQMDDRTPLRLTGALGRSRSFSLFGLMKEILPGTRLVYFPKTGVTYFGGDVDLNEDFWPVGRLLFAAAIFVLCGVGAWLAFRRRRAEDNGKTTAPMLLLILSFLPAAAFVAAIPVFFLGDGFAAALLPIVFLVLFLLVALARLKFPRFSQKEGKITLLSELGTAAACLVLVLCFLGGFFGFSSYVPRADKIESVQMTNVGAPSRFSTAFSGTQGDMIADLNSEPIELDVVFQQYVPANRLMSMPLLTSENDIHTALDIHRAILRDGRMTPGTGEDGETVFSADFMIVYRLKSGREVVRWYSALTASALDEALRLEDTEAFRDAASASLSEDGALREYYAACTFSFSDPLFSKTVTPELTNEDLTALWDALAADAGRVSAAERYSTEKDELLCVIQAVGNLAVTPGFYEQAPVTGEWYQPGFITEERRASEKMAATFPVTASCTETLAFLRDHGLEECMTGSYTLKAIRIRGEDRPLPGTAASRTASPKQWILSILPVDNAVFLFDGTEDGVRMNLSECELVTDPAAMADLLARSRSSAFLTRPGRVIYVFFANAKGENRVVTRFLPE